MPAASYRRKALVAGVIGPLLLPAVWATGTTSAHSPHDNVQAIQFSGSHTVTAIVRGRLMRSDDAGEHWKELVNGLPGERDIITSVALAPGDTTIGYAVSKSHTIFRTDDGGSNWQRTAVSRWPVGRFEVSPVDSDLVLAVGPRSSSLSADGGTTWQPVGPAETPIVDARFVDEDHLVGADSEGRLVVSNDAARTWSLGTDLGLPGRPRTVALVPRPGSEPIIFVGDTDGGLARSEDGGLTFDRVGAGLPRREIRGIAASQTAHTTPVLWLVTWTEGPFRSDDLGETWTTWSAGTTTDDQARERREPDWNTIAAVPGGSGEILLGGFSGMFALDAGAAAWRQIETLDRYVSGLAVSPDASGDSTVFVTSYVRGAFRSVDGGDTWETINDGLEFPDNPTSSFPVWRLHNIVVSPNYSTDQTVFTSTWLQIVRSDDGGHTWQRIDPPRTPDGQRLRLFVLATSPDFGADGTIYAGTRTGVLLRSVARGDQGTWEIVGALPERVRSIAVAGDDGRGRTILVGSAEHAYRSADGGRTWQQADADIVAEPEVGVQVAMSPRFADDGTALATSSDGLFVSHDGGVSWERCPGIAAGPVEAAAFSPAYGDDGIILASVRGQGLRRSDDGCATSDIVGRELSEANLLVADYAIPTSRPIQFSPDFTEDRTVFAFAQQEVLRSTDAGESWEMLTLPASDEVRATMHAERGGTTTRWAVPSVVVLLALIGTVAAAPRTRRNRSDERPTSR